MSEKDLDLKLLSRRLAWAQGFATRLNVPLRTVVDQRPGGSSFQEFTDLDVFSTRMSRNSQVETDLYDCKTSVPRSTERMFWLRGVVELFGTDQAWLVRESGITDAARNLASRLRLGTMTNDDLTVMLGVHEQGQPTHQAIGRLFDRAAIAAYQTQMTGLDKKLKPLSDALRYEVWMREPHHGLSMLPAALKSAEGLESANPAHVALMLDMAWLYLYSISHATAYVAASGANDVEMKLQEFYLGGQVGKRDKESLRAVFTDVTGFKSDNLTPDYYPALLEVFARLFVKPSRITTGMRYLEVVAAGVVAKRRPILTEAFGQEHDPVAAKLTLDVLTLLSGAGGLPPSFRKLYRDLLLGPIASAAASIGPAKEVTEPPERKTSSHAESNEPVPEPNAPEPARGSGDIAPVSAPSPEDEPLQID